MSWWRRKSTPDAGARTKGQFQLESLEPRILLSGDPLLGELARAAEPQAEEPAALVEVIDLAASESETVVAADGAAADGQVHWPEGWQQAADDVDADAEAVADEADVATDDVDTDVQASDAADEITPEQTNPEADIWLPIDTAATPIAMHNSVVDDASRGAETPSEFDAENDPQTVAADAGFASHRTDSGSAHDADPAQVDEAATSPNVVDDTPAAMPHNSASETTGESESRVGPAGETTQDSSAAEQQNDAAADLAVGIFVASQRAQNSDRSNRSEHRRIAGGGLGHAGQGLASVSGAGESQIPKSEDLDADADARAPPIVVQVQTVSDNASSDTVLEHGTVLVLFEPVSAVSDAQIAAVPQGPAAEDAQPRGPPAAAGNIDFLLLDGAAIDGDTIAPLTDGELEEIFLAAIQIWSDFLESRGLDFDFDTLSISAADLAGRVLGQTDGFSIWIDSNAAGHGWFVDTTPHSSIEFDQVQARADSDAAGRVDLLTVVLHEIGHVLGVSHSPTPGLMDDLLATGERLTPESIDSEALAALSIGALAQGGPMQLNAVIDIILNDYDMAAPAGGSETFDQNHAIYGSLLARVNVGTLSTNSAIPDLQLVNVTLSFSFLVWNGTSWGGQVEVDAQYGVLYPGLGLTQTGGTDFVVAIVDDGLEAPQRVTGATVNGNSVLFTVAGSSIGIDPLLNDVVTVLNSTNASFDGTGLTVTATSYDSNSDVTTITVDYSGQVPIGDWSGGSVIAEVNDDQFPNGDDDADAFGVSGLIDLALGQAMGQPDDYLLLDNMNVEDFGWPSYLNIDVVDGSNQLEMQFPDFRMSPDAAKIELEGTIDALDTGNEILNNLLSGDSPLFGLTLQGFVGLSVNMEDLALGQYDAASGEIEFASLPYTLADGLAWSVGGKIFGMGQISGTFIMNTVETNGQEVTYLAFAVDISMDLDGDGGTGGGGFGFGLNMAFGISEKGLLELFVFLETSDGPPIIIEPTTQLALDSFSATWQFFKQIEDLQTEVDDEPHFDVTAASATFDPDGGLFGGHYVVTLTLDGQHTIERNDRIRIDDNSNFDGNFTVKEVNGNDISFFMAVDPGTLPAGLQVIDTSIVDPLQLADGGFDSFLDPPSDIDEWRTRLESAVMSQVNQGGWEAMFQEIVVGGRATMSFASIDSTILYFDVDLIIDNSLNILLAGKAILFDGAANAIDISMFAGLRQLFFASSPQDIAARFLFLAELAPSGGLVPVSDALLLARGGVHFETLAPTTDVSSATTPTLVDTDMDTDVDAWEITFTLSEIPAFGFSVDDTIQVSGSNPNRYNGEFVVSAVNTAGDEVTFTINCDLDGDGTCSPDEIAATNPGAYVGGARVINKANTGGWGFRITVEGGIDANIPGLDSDLNPITVTTVTLEGEIQLDFKYIAPDATADPDPEIEIDLTFDVSLSETNVGTIADAKGAFHVTADTDEGLGNWNIEFWGAALLSLGSGEGSLLGYLALVGLEVDAAGLLRLNTSADAKVETLTDANEQPVEIVLPGEAVSILVTNETFNGPAEAKFSIDFDGDDDFAASEQVFLLQGLFAFEFSADQGFNIAIFNIDAQGDLAPAIMQVGPADSAYVTLNLFAFFAVRDDGIAGTFIRSLTVDLGSIAEIDGQVAVVFNTTGDDVTFNLPLGDVGGDYTGPASVQILRAPPPSVSAVDFSNLISGGNSGAAWDVDPGDPGAAYLLLGFTGSNGPADPAVLRIGGFELTGQFAVIARFDAQFFLEITFVAGLEIAVGGTTILDFDVGTPAEPSILRIDTTGIRAVLDISLAAGAPASLGFEFDASANFRLELNSSSTPWDHDGDGPAGTTPIGPGFRVHVDASLAIGGIFNLDGSFDLTLSPTELSIAASADFDLKISGATFLGFSLNGDMSVTAAGLTANLDLQLNAGSTVASGFGFGFEGGLTAMLAVDTAAGNYRVALNGVMTMAGGVLRIIGSFDAEITPDSFSIMASASVGIYGFAFNVSGVFVVQGAGAPGGAGLFMDLNVSLSNGGNVIAVVPNFIEIGGTFRLQLNTIGADSFLVQLAGPDTNGDGFGDGNAIVNLIGFEVAASITIQIDSNGFSIPNFNLTLDFFGFASIGLNGSIDTAGNFSLTATAGFDFEIPLIVDIDADLTVTFSNAGFVGTVDGSVAVGPIGVPNGDVDATLIVTSSGAVTISFSLSVTLFPRVCWPWPIDECSSAVVVSTSFGPYTIGSTTPRQNPPPSDPPPPPPPQPILGSVSGGELLIHAGVDAGLRGDLNAFDISAEGADPGRRIDSESFTITRVGGFAGNESIMVSLGSYSKVFHGVSSIRIADAQGGTDSFYIGPNVHSNLFLNGGDEEDAISYYGKGNVTILGGSGNDSIIVDIGGSSATTVEVYGGNDNDVISVLTDAATVATPKLFGEQGNDTLVFAGAGNAWLDGGGDNDLLSGSASSASQTMLGGSGNDTIVLGSGVTTVLGGGGDDTISWDASVVTIPSFTQVSGGDGVSDNSANDTFILVRTGVVDNITITAAGDNVALNLNGFDLTPTGIETLQIDTGAGADVVTVDDLATTHLHVLVLLMGAGDGVADSVTLNGTTGADDYLLTLEQDEEQNLTVGVETNGVHMGIGDTDAASGDTLTIRANNGVTAGPGGADEIDASGLTAHLMNLIFEFNTDAAPVPAVVPLSVRGSQFDDVFNIFTTASGAGLVIDGENGSDTYNVVLGDGAISTAWSIIDSGATGTDEAFLDSTDAADIFMLSPTLLTLGSQAIGYGGLETLDIESFGGVDTLLITGTHAGSTNFDTGSGADVVAIRAADGTTVVSTGAGDDAIYVGGLADTSGANTGGVLDGLNALLTIAAGAGFDILNIDDTADDQINTGTLSSSLLTGLGTANVSYSNIEDLALRLGSGADTLTIISTISGPTLVESNAGTDSIYVQTIAGPTTVNTNANNDFVSVGSVAPAASGTVNGIAALLTIDTGGSVDRIDVDDRGDNLAYSNHVTATTLTGLGMAEGIVFANTEQLWVYMGSGNDHTLVTSTHIGVTTLNAGFGDDTFIVGSEASGSGGTVDNIEGLLRLDGFLGTDVLNVDDTGDTDDNIGVIEGKRLTGLDMGRFAYDPDLGVEYVNFAQLNVNLGTGNDNFTIIASHDGATRIEARGGADTINVRTIIGATTILGDGLITEVFDDTFNVGSAAGLANDNFEGSLDGIAAPLTLRGGGLGDVDRLTVDDSADTDSETGVLRSNLITGLGMGLVGITYSGMEVLHVTLGTGDDAFHIASTHSQTTRVNAGPGADVITIESMWGPTDIEGDDPAEFTRAIPVDAGVSYDDTVLVNAFNDQTQTFFNGVGGPLGIDGQDGSDTVTVYMAGVLYAPFHPVSTIDVHDSGSDGGSDKLDIYGVNLAGVNDRFLVRQNFVALLHDSPFESAERVNYDASLEGGLELFALAGDDLIVVDDTATTTTIHAGLGNDEIRVGQVFQSTRDFPQIPVAADEFATLETTVGYLSNGNRHATSISGGAGNNVFTVLHNSALLTLTSDSGIDTFTVLGLALAGSGAIDPNQQLTAIAAGGGDDQITYTIDAPISVDAGADFDSVDIFGTGSGDTIDVAANGVTGAGQFVELISAEILSIDALAGDDLIRIATLAAGVTLDVFGGLGNDHFEIGDGDLAGIQGSLTLFGGVNPAVPPPLPAPFMYLGETDAQTFVPPTGTNPVDETELVDSVDVFNSASTRDDIGELSDTQISGLGLADAIVYTDIEALHLALGTGNDTFHIGSTHSQYTRVNAGPGADVMTVESIWGATDIEGAAAADAVLVNAFSDQTQTFLNGIGGPLGIDGQDGSDTVIVYLAGVMYAPFHPVSTIDVRDSGSDGGADKLNLYGVDDAGVSDSFLVRQNFVALLHDSPFESAERVNYDASLEGGLELFALAGDDLIVVDDTATTTTIHAGLGNDEIRVGQVFSSTRDFPQIPVAADEFATLETTVGYLSNGNRHATSISGGAGNNVFTVLHNSALLTLTSDSGNDTFTVLGLALAGSGAIDPNQQLTAIAAGGGDDQITYAIDAPISVDAGADFDSVDIFGTGSGDTIDVAANGVTGAGQFVELVSAEILSIDALAGDDLIRVATLAAGVTLDVFGGLGNDHFEIGDGDLAGIQGSLTLFGGVNPAVPPPLPAPLMYLGETDAQTFVPSAAPNALVVETEQVDSLDIYNGASTRDDVGELSDMQITGLGLAGGIAYADFEALHIELGTGNDELLIRSTHGGLTTISSGAGAEQINILTLGGPTLIDTGAGDDVVNIGTGFDGSGNSTIDQISALLALDTGAGADTVNIDDTGDTSDAADVVTDTTFDDPDLNEAVVQILTISNAAGGSFSIQVGTGASTLPLAFNASAADIKSALLGLGLPGVNDVLVNRAGNTYVISFLGDETLAGTDLTLSGDAAGLVADASGQAPAIAAVADAPHLTQTFVVDALAGTFNVIIGDFLATFSVTVGDTAAAFEAALIDALRSTGLVLSADGLEIGANDVQVSQFANAYIVTYLGLLRGTLGGAFTLGTDTVTEFLHDEAPNSGSLTGSDANSPSGPLVDPDALIALTPFDATVTNPFANPQITIRAAGGTFVIETTEGVTEALAWDVSGTDLAATLNTILGVSDLSATQFNDIYTISGSAASLANILGVDGTALAAAVTAAERLHGINFYNAESINPIEPVLKTAPASQAPAELSPAEASDRVSGRIAVNDAAGIDDGIDSNRPSLTLTTVLSGGEIAWSVSALTGLSTPSDAIVVDNSPLPANLSATATANAVTTYVRSPVDFAAGEAEDLLRADFLAIISALMADTFD